MQINCGINASINMIFGTGIVRPLALLLLVLFNECVSVQLGDNSISQVANDATTDTMLARMGELLVSIDQRLSSLEDRLDQVLEPKTFPRALNPAVPFQIIRVTKKDLGDFIKVRVDYEASAFPKAIQLLWDTHITRAQEVELEDQVFGVVEVEVPKHNELSNVPVRDVDISLVFVFEESFYTAELSLFNTPDMMEVPPITLHVAQGTRVTFTPGQSAVSVDVTTKLERDVDALHTDGLSFDVYAKSSNASSSGYSRRNIRAESSHTGQYGNRLWEVTVRAESGEPECVLVLRPGVFFDCSRNCLLKGLIASLSVHLQREDHSEAFPEGFLDLAGADFASHRSVIYCDLPREDVWSPCILSCEVFGADTTTADIAKISPGGDVIPTADVTMSLGWWSTSQLSIVNVSLADGGEYRCTGRSGSNEISRDISLAVVSPARIDRASSYFRELENGSVAAVCVAEGVPAPNITFWAETFDDVNAKNYVITMTQLNESTTRADLLFTNGDKAPSPDYYYCFAKNLEDASTYQRLDRHEE